jgi:hypothetical protein
MCGGRWDVGMYVKLGGLGLKLPTEYVDG